MKLAIITTIIISLLALACMFLSYSFTVYAENTPLEKQNATATSSLDATLYKLSICESNRNPFQITLYDGWRGETAFGMFQYQLRTWNWLTKRYKLKDADIFNPSHQEYITRRALEENRQSLWFNCFKKLGFYDK